MILTGVSSRILTFEPGVREAFARAARTALGVWLRDMRKRASLLTGDLDAASKLLQHSGTAVTAKHYPVGARLKPSR